ncbi:DUF4320 family protein [Pygmaiobacter massiliensis]|uniref:DUF4320 family protein n=1 Tax=Pygmaiobacter massiliensis TaxID=1917873 RepID=UPI002A7ED3EF|nr:DUF4320 family protein [Pygmaiobacter massiliensis]MDY4785536.1 DUF4320 family protein [Pygmaiobacter massiliensis]
MKHLKNNRGSVLIEFLVVFLCFMLCIAFALAILPAFTQKQKLDDAAEKIMRLAELRGSTGTHLQMKVDELKAETGIDFTASFEGTDWLNAAGEVQLGHDIKLELVSSADIGFYTFASITVPIHSRQSGTSEKYYK